MAGRLALSSVLGEAADSLLFFPIAILGVVTVREMFSQLLLQFVLKSLYEIILIPVIIPLIKRLKAYEGEDVYDEEINYGIFDIFKRG